jgi:hypothetical protein
VLIVVISGVEQLVARPQQIKKTTRNAGQPVEILRIILSKLLINQAKRLRARIH